MPRPLAELVEALRRLPGVGPKSAQRLALHLLERDREGALRLARALEAAVEGVGRCERCRNLSESPRCAICASPSRDASLLCVVEHPLDLISLEQATGFRGLYFVLHGRLSPVDGLGPEELGFPELAARLAAGEVRELIIATNATVEGEATAHFLAELAARHGVRATRLAFGLPVGGELEYADRGTIAHAFQSRRPAGELER
ncbi:MAG: recombination mediator RecR [Xanthomonadales bacterium]|nr:recombination mediator RecR [Xanthomonadales bacterium]